VHPQVADRVDGLKVWRIAVNVLNKQSWMADKGWPFRYEVNNFLTVKTQHVTKCYTGPCSWWAVANVVMNLWVP